MAKVLLLGGDGLLGSCLEQALRSNHEINLIVTARNHPADRNFTYSIKDLSRLVAEVRPNFIINCIAASSTKKSTLDMFKANALLPLQLACIGLLQKIRVIHFSTNAVFSGFHSLNYEKSIPFPRTKYGFTKLVGDLSMFGNLILRTSFVGSSPKHGVHSGLLSKLQKLDSHSTYTISENYLWNGVTTDALCELISYILRMESFPRGLLHLNSNCKIQRFDLVMELLTALGRDDVHVLAQPSNRVRNLGLDSTRHDLISSIWAGSSYRVVPEFKLLIRQMKIH